MDFRWIWERQYNLYKSCNLLLLKSPYNRRRPIGIKYLFNPQTYGKVQIRKEKQNGSFHSWSDHPSLDRFPPFRYMIRKTFKDCLEGVKVFLSSRNCLIVYPNAVYRISISYHAWNMSKSLCAGGGCKEQTKPNNSAEISVKAIIRFPLIRNRTDFLNIWFRLSRNRTRFPNFGFNRS